MIEAQPSARAKTTFAGVAFDQISEDETIAWLRGRSAADRFAYIVTPNADHVVRLHNQPDGDEMQAAYRDADLCLCDSRVMQLIARALGRNLAVVSGSDLIARFLPDHLPDGRSLVLIGGDTSTRDALAAIVSSARIAHHSPPMGLLGNQAAMDEAAAFAVSQQADYVLLAVGSPQQEIIAHRIAADPQARGTGLCIGASIDFLTGRTRRAPPWMRRLALEWLHRLLCDPKRLWRRYLVHSPKILLLAWRS